MPTKTDRILSYLPGTFRALPRPTALYAVVDAFGGELLQAENSLAAVMQAHWVDHADRGAEVIDDLACLAALYGLAPRADESIEEFREHLKRYVRTFLEGTVTVQGILRVTAEALGLHIAGAYEDLDTWWTRDEDELITDEPRGDDAAGLVLGVEAVTVTGSPVRPAQVAGKVGLSHGVDLRDIAMLCLKVDDEDPVEVSLVDGSEDPASVQLDEIVERINDKLRSELGDEYESVADSDGDKLTLTSPTIGPTSRLEVQGVDNDAAERVLGLAPWAYQGSEALAAQVTGTADLSGGVDLREERYLRLAVDGTHLAEIDCAGPDPANTALAQICDKINNAFAPDVVEATSHASHEEHYLRLTTRSTGSGSSIAFQPPAAQDATVCIFGPLLPVYYVGQDDQPARVTGRDLSGGVDLSERPNIQLRIDGESSGTISCAGDNPANTRPAEIAAAINAAFSETFEKEVATHNGRVVTLASPTVGPSGQIVFETPPGDDATEDIFGIGPRTFEGAAATAARIVGERDLSSGVDLRAQHFLRLAADGRPPSEIDLRSAAADPWAVALTLDEVADAINNALGDDIATGDGQHLILTSQTTGGASSLAIEPLEITRRRRFVTRAMITDEASQDIFGFTRCQARGTPATSARIVGERDLSRGVDLREARYLRLAVDDCPAVDIDCAGKRPHATLINEVVKAINDALEPDLEADLAAHDGLSLVLTSPSSGADSRIAFEPPRMTDALDTLLGVEPGTFRGQDATGIRFVGTVDLSDGVDLEANAAIKLGVDGLGSAEIILGDPEPSHKTLDQIVNAINGSPPIGLDLDTDLASHDGRHIILTLSPKPEGEGVPRLVFATPSKPDATEDILGIIPPRTYQGAEATPAKVVGMRELSGEVDLQVSRYLRLTIDDGSPVDVDCASEADDPTAVNLDEIVEAINASEVAQDEVVASGEGAQLVLTSIRTGLAGRLTLEHHTSGDARKALMGDVEDVTKGTDPSKAVITGEADLLTPVDLSQRRWIRPAVDGGRPVDIDVAGAAPQTTFLDEIVAAINEVFPGLASATEDDRLQLTSPTAGARSHLALLPLRYLELIEYPPEPTEMPSQSVKHGDGWSIVNDGAADVFAEVELTAPQGVFGPMLVNETLGWRIRLLTILRIGETACLWRDPERGLQAEICPPDPDGKPRPVPGSEILVGPLGSQAWVPFEDNRPLTGDDENPASLQLNNPLAPSLIVLRARQAENTDHVTTVAVTESDLSAAGPKPVPADGSQARLVGRVRAEDGTYCLVDADEDVIAHLRAGPGLHLAAYRDRVVMVTGSPDAGEPSLMIVDWIALVGRVRAEDGTYRLVDADEDVIAHLRAGSEVKLAVHENHVVAVAGPLHAGEPPLMIVHWIADLFDVALRIAPEEGDLVRERYAGVTIGVDTKASHSLVRQINARPSQLVKAEALDKGTVLALPRGRSDWRYVDCYGSRFNQVYFDAGCFAGGQCGDRGVFNVSRFAYPPGDPKPGAECFAQDSPEKVSAVFAPSTPSPDPPTEVTFRWASHRPGAFRVNLPADLPARFGGRFNQARFGQSEDTPERYFQAVTEPPEDQDYLVNLINYGRPDDEPPLSPSMLVTAEKVASAPLGWEAVTMPFRKPEFLSLGAKDAAARLYLAEEGLDEVIELQAREAGTWGNEIAITARQSGPAMYDVTIAYEGARFENARRVALGLGLPSPPPSCKKRQKESGIQQAAPDGDLPTLIRDLLQPGPIGVLQAKAAGVRAAVSRDRAESGC